MASIYRVFVEKLGGANAATFVGNQGELFWDPTTQSLKMSDGTTAGGIIAGGGSLLYALSKDSDNPLIVEAFTTPLNLIAAYCDVFVEPEMVDGEFNGIGYNAKTNEWCNLIEAGVIDPVDVVVNSIRSAISIATLVLLSEAMVALPRD